MLSRIHRYLTHRSFRTVSFFLFIVTDAVCASAKHLPEELRDYLQREIRLDKKQIALIQAGQSVTKSLPTEKREEVAIFGIVHLNVTQEFFLTRFRDSLNRESSNESLQNRIFNTPPNVSDVAELNWENDDLEKIRDCDPKNCTARLPGGSVTLLQKKVDWKSKSAFEKANVLLRSLSIEYVAKYQTSGDETLTFYDIHGKAWSVKEGTHILLKHSTYLAERAPALASYLQNYPNEQNPDAEDIFYWQKASFGLQPVIRFNHVVIWPIQSFGTMIASKVLYANHYFRDALELRSLISGSDSQSIYLVVINRSHVDGMTGFQGRFVRGSAVSKSVEQLKEMLMKTKASMEKKFGSGQHQAW
jgi:hypothetical protein